MAQSRVGGTPYICRVAELSRTQEQALRDLVRRGRGARAPTDLPERLTKHIEEGLDGIPVAGISLNKQALKVAEQCPARLQAHMEREGEWVMSAEFAAGKVLHRAAEVDAGARERLPLDGVIDQVRFRALSVTATARTLASSGLGG